MYRVSQRNPTQSLARDLAENYSNLLAKSTAKSLNSVESESNRLILHKVNSLPTLYNGKRSEVITHQPKKTIDTVCLDSYNDDVTDSAGCDSDSY